MLSNLHQDIHLFRFDEQTADVFILAGANDEHQIVVPLSWTMVFPMKPNFAQMSKAELKAYVRANRDDIEAIRFLFQVPPGVEPKRYPPMYNDDGTPIEENIRVAQEAIRQRVEEANQKRQHEKEPD